MADIKRVHGRQRKLAREYERQAEDYASCRFVEQFGSQMVHPKAKRVQSNT